MRSELRAGGRCAAQDNVSRTRSRLVHVQFSPGFLLSAAGRQKPGATPGRSAGEGDGSERFVFGTVQKSGEPANTQSPSHNKIMFIAGLVLSFSGAKWHYIQVHHGTTWTLTTDKEKFFFFFFVQFQNMLLWGHFLDVICSFSRLADEVKRIVQLALAWQDLPGPGDTAGGISTIVIWWWISVATW